MIRLGVVVLGLLLAGCGVPPGPTAPLEFIPPIECRGIPAGTCQQIVTEARRNAEPGTFPLRIRAVCTRAACTLQEGDVSVEIDYSNGRTESYGMGWSGPAGGDAPPPPVVLPVEPVCLAVPAGPCRERAEEAFEANVDREVRSIVVECTADACTDLDGDGETRITFADGTSLTATWGYMTGG